MHVAAISGTVGPSARTNALLELALDAARVRGGTAVLLDLQRDGIDWCDGRDPATYGTTTVAAIDAVRAADAIVVGTPVYRGSYSGRLKNFFDLIPSDLLAGKPALLVAAGASLEHRLAIDTALRPLLAQFAAHVLPQSVYSTPEDFVDGQATDAVRERVAAAAGALCDLAARLGA
ncbi:MAG: NAD(P)H-dependent oxidoreductase [Thermoleophilia bacterium]